MGLAYFKWLAINIIMASKENKESDHCCCHGTHGATLGIALLIIGLLLLARDVGFIAGVGSWTIIFFILGVFLLAKKCCR